MSGSQSTSCRSAWAACAAAKSSSSSTTENGTHQVRLTVFSRSPRQLHGLYVKRVLALDHDVIRPADGRAGLATVPEGHCWVEGDNGRRSADSNSYGPVRATGRKMILLETPALDPAGADRRRGAGSGVAAAEHEVAGPAGGQQRAPGAPQQRDRGHVICRQSWWTRWGSRIFTSTRNQESEKQTQCRRKPAPRRGLNRGQQSLEGTTLWRGAAPVLGQRDWIHGVVAGLTVVVADVAFWGRNGRVME